MERIIYRNPETGFSIATLHVDAALQHLVSHPRVTLRGTCPVIAKGFRLELVGRLVAEPGKGGVFYVEQSTNKEEERMRMRDLQDLNEQELIELLSCGMFKRIGVKSAERIVRYFGGNTVKVLDNVEAAQRLQEVHRIGPRTAKDLSNTWLTLRSSQLTLTLMKLQIPLVHSQRLFAKYGDTAFEAIQRNPYRLVDDLPRFGFDEADAIAQRLGFGVANEKRVTAAVTDVLQRSANNRGHCYLEEDVLINQTLRKCGLKVSDAGTHMFIRRVLQKMVQNAGLHMRGNNRYYLPELYWMEWRFTTSICERMAHMENSSLEAPYANSRLSEEQLAAVQLMLSSQVSILSGPPGSGKTFCLHAVTEEWARQGKSILLACPTARAAKRLEASTRLKASTIHRALEYSPSYWTDSHLGSNTNDPSGTGSDGFYDSIGQYFARDRYNQLDVDAVIIDETSMLDIGLGTALLEAIPMHARLVFVGDYNQLPSVGPGRLFRDLIESAFIPTVSLHKSFRQAGGLRGRIAQEAERIRHGKVPACVDFSLVDQMEKQKHGEDRLLWLECEDEQDVAEAILGNALQLAQDYGFDPLEDVQVLSPMNQGLAGTVELNRALRNKFNPNVDPLNGRLVFAKEEYRVGDRVMQKVNNYSLGVFNGTIGTIQEVDAREVSVTIAFQEVNSFHLGEDGPLEEPSLVTYEKWKIPSNISLSYACTVHKSQGSEYPAVIVPVFNTHHHLNRSMLYTAVTRAKQLVIVIGQREALERAVAKLDNLDRNTSLQTLLQHGLGQEPKGIKLGSAGTTTWDLEHLRRSWQALELEDI